MNEPGSTEAGIAGCTCPILDNAHGLGIPVKGSKYFWINDDCPLHGTKRHQPTPDDDDDWDD